MSRDDHEVFSTTRLDRGLWLRLLGYTRPYRRALVQLVLCAIVTAGMDALYPLITRQLIDDIAARGAAAELGRLGLAYAAVTLVLALSVRGFVRAAGVLRTHVSHDIRRDGFATLQRLSFAFFDRNPVGWLMARMTSDCERLSNILTWGLLDLTWCATLMAGMALAMFLLAPGLAAIVLAVMPVLLGISVVFQRRILSTARAVRATNSRITASYNEAVMAAATTKTLVREEANAGEFGALSGAMYSASVTNAQWTALYMPLVVTVSSVAAGLALALGGADVRDSGLSLGTLVAFMAYITHFFEPARDLALRFAEMQMAQASAERLFGLIDQRPDVDDPPAHLAVLAHDERRIGRLEFRGVGFHYLPGRPVLQDLELCVEPGQTVALVGPTGGGKSTLVGLVTRFHDPTAGAVLADGVDLRHHGLAWLQDQFGIVLQDPYLFGGSVADNIRYGRLDASDAEVEAAARAVGAHDVFAALAQGYATEVGEGGGRLSTGQKQLVAFARVVLKDPAVLILDEATASVDTETERRLMAAMDGVLAGRTAFVIAHRLSTVRRADQILVIDGGRLVERGTHAELLAAHGRYHDLCLRQGLREAGFAATG